MNYLLTIFRFIESRGISDAHQEDNKLTRLLNIICALTSFGSLGIFVGTYLFTTDYVYMTVSMGVTITYLVMIVLHHFHQIETAKLYFSTIIPLWYVMTMLSIGGHFSQSIAAVATIVITYLMYKEQKKLRTSLITYNIFLFILPTLYITFYQPIFGVHDYPIDEIVVFLLCLGWISIVFSIYEGKKQDYIESLQKKNRELEQKTQELERFTYIASHDLKSPLRNIVSFVNLIKRDIKRENYGELSEYLDFVETGAIQMRELIDGVLIISEVDNKNREMEYVEIDLNRVFKKVTLNLKHDIESQKAKIATEDLPSFFGEAADFVIVFQNLIQNGIKYNESLNPEVFVSTTKTNRFMVLHFTDNGIGLKEEYYDRIFEFFRRLHTAEEYSGTGLGLGLCKKIIEKYNGRIEVDSKLGEGTRFSVFLPIGKQKKKKRSNHKQVADNPV